MGQLDMHGTSCRRLPTLFSVGLVLLAAVVPAFAAASGDNSTRDTPDADCAYCWSILSVLFICCCGVCCLAYGTTGPPSSILREDEEAAAKKRMDEEAASANNNTGGRVYK